MEGRVRQRISGEDICGRKAFTLVLAGTGGFLGRQGYQQAAIIKTNGARPELPSKNRRRPTFRGADGLAMIRASHLEGDLPARR